MKKTLFTFLFAVSLFSAFSQKAPVFVNAVEGVKEYKLENGLKVLLLNDPSQSNVVVNITYNVGSRHEGYGEKGMAHLLEHMLFKSTKNLGDIKKMLSDKGGQANGTTWFDRTNYYEIFPSTDENLKWSLEMEADRMLNATILQEDLDKEFSVVRNEFEIGENNPDGVLSERVISSAYLWHNYGNSTIGSREDIERVKADRLRLFYEKYYQPDNATLVIGGKFDEKKALEYITTYFASIPKPNRVLEKTYTVEPPQDGERFVELRRAGDVQIVSALYHTAAYADKDYAAIDALNEVLTNDPSGTLYKALVDGGKATNIYGWSPTVRDPGFLYFSVTVAKDKSLDEAKKVFLAELDKISTQTFTEQDLSRAKAKLLKGLENLKNNTLGMSINLTEIIGAGDYRLLFLYRDAVEKLTVADLQRVAAKYFIPSNRTQGIFIPEKDAQRVRPKEYSDEEIVSLTQNYKGKAEEEAVAEFEASIPNIKKNLHTSQLQSGMKLGVLNKAIKGKKVVANFRFPTGTLESLTGTSETAAVLSSLLKAGTSTKSKEQLQDELDQLRSQVSMYISGQTLAVNVSSYEDTFEATMKLVKDMLTNATFPEAEFKKNVDEMKTNIEASRNDPQSVAMGQIGRYTTKYPKGHIFYSASPDEEIAGLNAVNVAKVKALYKTLGSNYGYGSVVSGLPAEKVKSIVNSTFGGWTTKAKYAKVQPTYFPTQAQVEKVITPDKENGVVMAQMNYELDRKSPDYPALVIADAILGSGGFLNARIPLRLREKEGISYGAGSFASVPYDNKVAGWGVYAFFNPKFQEKVDAAIREEIANALKTGFTQEELDSHKKSWLTGRKTNLGSDGFLSSNLVNNLLYLDIPLEDYDKMESQVQALTLDQVNAALRKYVNPDKLVFLYAGDFNKKD
jgi:zinc protease